MPLYTFTHVGGLHDVIRDELDARLPDAQVVGGEYGRLHVDFPGDPACLLQLRTIENVYAQVLELADVAPHPAWLDELEAALARLDLTPAVGLLARLKPLPSSPTFRVTAERLGKHEYRSQEIAGAAGAGVIAAMGWGVSLEHFDIEVRVDVRDDRAWVGVRLSEHALHKRSRLVHPRVTLNPTVAAAMVRLSHPRPGELVVDPTVGGGTLLTERHAHDPDVRLIGGDMFAEKLDLARQNFAALGVPARLVQWDASRLPLADETVDVFLLNPPWGRLVASHRINERLYPRLLQHLCRCLKPDGRIVLLTSERALVRRFRDAHPDLVMTYHQRLNLGGLAPSIHVLEQQAMGR